MIPGLKTSPAFNGAGSSGTGGGGVASLTFVNSALSSGSTIAIPNDAVAGDIAVLLDAAADEMNDSISAVTPTGWTNVANTFGTGTARSVRLKVSRKILVAGDPGKTITGMNSDFERKIMLVFRPNTSIVGVVASTWNGQVTSGNPSVQTVSASGQPAPLILFAFASLAAGPSASTPAFTTETPALTNLTLSSGKLAIRAGYKIYDTSPADLSIDIDDNGDNNGLQSGYLRFT